MAFGAVACTGQAAVGDGESPRIFDCMGAIDILDAPPDRWSPVLDVIAVPDEVLQRGRFDEEMGRRFSKFGLVIRADRAFVFSVAESSQPNVLMGWGTGAGLPVPSIEFTGCSGVCETDFQPNCPLGESGQWVVYAGGLWTTDAACIDVEVVADEQTATARLPVGVECR